MAKIPQPAKKSYFFDKGYVDMRNTIKGAWSRNGESIGNYAENLQDLGNISSLPIKIFMAVINILAIIAMPNPSPYSHAEIRSNYRKIFLTL